MGITGDSVFVYTSGYEKKLKEYDDSHWIIQEFIDGREFNISILFSHNGPEVMPPAEMVFHNFEEGKPKIVDFKAKWIEGSFEYENTIREFPTKSLIRLIRKDHGYCLKCWQFSDKRVCKD
jgi:D-alanine-D-alanine ligase